MKMMMGIWFIFFILIIAGIIIFIISASKKTGFIPIKENSRNNTLEILKERYVKGEITDEEFNRIKKDII